MTKFKVTIIITTYNAGKFIEGCLQSIAGLQMPSLQVIVKDGGSRDETLALLEPFRQHIDILISEKDKGIYDGMNKALPYIKGNWVLFLGADDRLLPSFAAFVQQLQNTDTIYYGDCETPAGILGDPFSAYRLTKMNACHQGILYPAAVFQQYQYQPQYTVNADHVLNMQCWGDPSYKKKYLPIRVSHFDNAGFSSYTTDHIFLEHKPQLIKQLLGWRTYLRYRFRQFKQKNFSRHA